MFGKKSSQPKSLWNVQVLTLDYLIEGQIEQDGIGAQILPVLAQPQAGYILRIASARIQPTGNLAAPVHSVPQWTMSLNEAFVAIIPRDEASLQYARKNNDPAFEYAMPAEVYAGPYLIRGTVLRQMKDFIYLTSRFPVRDAEIDCLLPGAQLTRLTAPYLIVHSRLVHGIAPKEA